MMPSELRKLLVASSWPFSCAAGRCWISAFSGTMNRPPEKPSAARHAQTAENDGSVAGRIIENRPMPIEPSGTSPSSTLSPERRPAIRLPRPMPPARNVARMPVRTSSRFIVSCP